MQGFLEYSVKKLADHPEDVNITSDEKDKFIEFRLSLNPKDIGKIIGRHGRTISAIRTLINTVAVKHGKRVAVEINEPPDDSPKPEESVSQ